MPSVGSHLRQLREARGVSLEEIARATRVNSSYLVALETDDHASLPVPVFTRGFIRAYCQALGEAPEQSLALYDGRGDVATAVATAAPAATPVAAPASSSASAAEPVRRTTPDRVRRTAAEPVPRNRGPVLVSFILLVVLGVALFAMTLLLQSGRESAEDRRLARMPVRQPDAPHASAPATTASPAPANSAVPAAPSAPAGYRLVARAAETTWMRVRMEDGKTVEETIPAGQMREWFSTGPFTLTIGNAGGVHLELNGRSLPSLGASGVVIPRLVLPPESQ